MKTQIIILLSLSLFILSCKTERKIITNSGAKEISKKEFDTFFMHLKDSLNMPGISVAIINNSKVVYHNASGVKVMDEPISADTYFEAASLSKPLFAFFALKQVEKGILDLDKPLFEYLPYPDIEYDERYKLITARMILSHSSGFPNWREDSLKINFTPGTNYMYSGEGYKYLAHVLAEVNKVPFSELHTVFQKDIAQPMGANKLFYKWNSEIAQHKATGHQNDAPTSNKRDHKDNDFGAAGGLHTEAINYAKFLTSLFDHTVLSKASTEEMLKEQIELPEDDINRILIGASGWSLGLGQIPTPNGMCYWHAGNNDDFQSWMHFYPDKKYGIVLFTNSDKVQNPVFFQLFFDFMDDGINFDLSKLN